MALKKQNWMSDGALLLVILLVVFFLPNILFFVKQMTLPGLLRPQRIASIRIETEGSAGEQHVFLAGEHIIVSVPGRLDAYSREGELQWSRELNGRDTQVYPYKETMLLSEMNRGEIVTVNTQNQVIAHAKDLGPIDRLVRLSDTETAILFQAESKIVLYNEELTPVRELQVPYGEIVEMKYSHNDHALLVYTTHLNDYAFESYVLQYSKSGDIIGSLDCKDMLIYDMHLYDYLILVGNKKLWSYSHEAQPIAEIDTPGMIDHSHAYKSRLYLTVVDPTASADAENVLHVLNDSLITLKKQPLEEAVNGISVNERFIALFSGGKVWLYDHGFKEVLTLNSTLAIEALKWLDDFTFIIYDAHEISVYGIR
jgi:hypothetical protein